MIEPSRVRLLIIKRDKLGDLLLARPVIAHARAIAPDAQIHLLANDYNAWVARDHPALTCTWVYPRVRSGGRMHPLAAYPIMMASDGLLQPVASLGFFRSGRFAHV